MKTMINAAVFAALASPESPKGGRSGAAVQNTSLDGKTLGEVIKDLDRSDLKAAYKAIDTAYDIQFGKDGIEDTQNKLVGLQGRVGEQVYAVAKVAMAHCKNNLVIARSYFLALCSQAETHCQNKYIEKHHEELPMGQLIPLWSQYKSYVAKGLEKGLDPNSTMEDSDAPKFATAAQYRAAVQQIEKEERATGSQAGNERNSEGQVATQLQLVAKGWSPKLQASMEVLCKGLNRLTHEEQDTFASDILEIAAKVTTFANQANRSAVGDARTDAQKEAGETDLDSGTTAALQAALDKEEPKGKGSRKGARAA